MMTKPEWFGRLRFLQCIDIINDLYCLVESKQPEKHGIRQCVLLDGGINFCSNHGGKNCLVDLAGFLIGIGRQDLISTSEMRLVTRGVIDAIYENWEVDEKHLVIPDLAQSEWRKKIHMNFSSWRMNSTSYEPKYVYPDNDEYSSLPQQNSDNGVDAAFFKGIKKVPYSND